MFCRLGVHGLGHFLSPLDQSRPPATYEQRFGH
jgi:hypothetical protein